QITNQVAPSQSTESWIGVAKTGLFVLAMATVKVENLERFALSEQGSTLLIDSNGSINRSF
ncbi:hypothetical protein, partial [Pseudomonas sp. SIMBA_021]|uniref:hypothetical protein n=1 Tax=Pseudomonas sp. SIMBA_021 TaxID=3085767 RepID=UPI0039796AC1